MLTEVKTTHQPASAEAEAERSSGAARLALREALHQLQVGDVAQVLRQLVAWLQHHAHRHVREQHSRHLAPPLAFTADRLCVHNAAVGRYETSSCPGVDEN